MSVRDRWLLAAVLLLAALLRVGYLVEIRQAPDFDRPQFESQYHDYWARALASGDWTPPAGVTDPEITRRPYFRPPGYPTFLSVIHRIGGGGYLAPRVAQALLGLVSCTLVFFLTRRWFGRVAAVAAGVLQGWYWIFIYFEGEFMAPPLLVPLILVVLGSLASWTVRVTPVSAVIAGLATGAAAVVRPNMVALVPVFLLWALWVEWRRDDRSWVGFCRGVVVYSLATVVVILPVTIRNHRVADDRVLITSNAGINLFIGIHPDSDGITPGVPELAELTGMTGWDSFDYPLIVASVERLEGRTMKDSEVSRWFAARALERATERPGDVLRSFGRKLLLFWGPAEISNTKVIHFERIASPTLRRGPGFATVLALGVLGAALYFVGRRRPSPTSGGADRPDLRVVVLLLAFVAGYAATYAPFFVAARFRVPVIPILIVFGGYAIQCLVRTAYERRWVAFASAVVVLALVRLTTGIEWAPYGPDESTWHWRRGLLFEREGRLDRAIEEFRAAVVSRPGHAAAQLSLAEAGAAVGDLSLAADAYRACLESDAASAVCRNGLALILARTGDLESAMQLWERSLEFDSSDPAALNNLAATLLTHPQTERRDIVRAVALAERGVEATENRDADLLRTLAAAYQAAGREADAQAILDRLEGLSGAR